MFILGAAHFVQLVYYTPLITNISYVTKTRYRIFWVPVTIFNIAVAIYVILDLVDIKKECKNHFRPWIFFDLIVMNIATFEVWYNQNLSMQKDIHILRYIMQQIHIAHSHDEDR